jgi:hypothetical protein
MQITFNLSSKSERDRVKRIIAQEEAREFVNPVSKEEEKRNEAWQLLSREVASKFLRPLAARTTVSTPPMTAREMANLLSLPVETVDSYIRIVWKFPRKHPALQMEDIFTVSEEKPRKYAISVRLRTLMG